jgi:translocation and assembly module TamB
MATPDTPPPRVRIPAPPGGPLRALWQLLQPVLWVVLALALVAGALGGVAVWLLRSADGTAWLLARVPGLEVQGTRGALLSDRFGAERVVVRWDQGRQSVTIEALQGQGLQWSWHPAHGAWLGLQAQHLSARRVDVQTGPPGPRPVVMPRSLQLPLRLQVQQVDVAELRIDSLAPMRTVQGRNVRLWEPGGREYHGDAISFDWDRAHVAGSVSLGGLPPFTLQAQARLSSRGDGPAWTADARAQGPLAQFELQATLRGTAARARAEVPSLDLQVGITPLEAWPLGRLRLRTQALDLSALAGGAPQTAISGQVDIDSRSRDGPLAATVDLDNTSPGRWNEARVPVRRLQARLRSPDQDRQRLQLESFDLQLARGQEAAGRWQGKGEWAGGKLSVDSQLDSLRPQLLDGRAAVMALSGPLAFVVNGLPAPDPRAAAAAGPRPRSLDLRTTLEGRIEGSPHAVKLVLDASADGQGLDLRDLQAEAGAARAQLSATARRAGGSGWQLRSSGSVSDFDPVPWWPGHEGSPWRAGPHRLSGSWTLDVAMPRIGVRSDVLSLLQGLVGKGSLAIDRSQLAGVPVALKLELDHQPGAGATPGRVNGEMTLGGNRLTVQGQGDPLGPGHADQLQFELQAPALPGLAPLARLWPELAPWAPRGGRIDASVAVNGRWPDARSDGKATAQGLQAGTLQLRQAQARWQVDTASDQPLLLQADAQGLVLGAQRLDQLRYDLRGTLRQHQLELTAALPYSPPALLEQALGLRTGAGAQVQLRGNGQWTPDGSGGGRWTGQGAQLLVGPWSAGGNGAVVSPWLEGRDLRAEVRFDAGAGLAEVQAGAGQVRLADTATLRWDEVRVDLRGAAPAFALRADIEPFLLAPLLARSQPALGWAGDLRLAARVDMKVADKVDADIVFERRDGDLRVSEENASQPFGLSELRLAANAHDGDWRLSASFLGRTLGEIKARLNLRPRPEQRWPSADTPIDGTIEGQVANLGMWGNWVPPGWRLSGALSTKASVTGRVGEPDYAGEVVASDVAVRNLLLGVDVRQGEALVRLQGATARIERLSARGGDGLATATGRIELTGKPGSFLKLQAERFRVLGRVDRQLITSGELTFDQVADQPRLRGLVRVDEGLFDLSRSDAPSLDDDVSVRQPQAQQPEPGAAPAPRTRRHTQVAVDLDLGDRLRVRGRGLDTTLGGQLKLGSVAGRMTLHGIVTASGGTYAAYGQKLDIDRGIISFSGDLENPTLDVLALRPDLDTQVGVAINGPLQSLRVRLYSSTDMSESDKLSWLVLGRASEGLGRADTALLQRAAVALMAGEGEAPTDTLLRNLGLDQLSVRQSDTDVRDTVISLGKQLSRRWYVGYERGVNATAGTWQLIYRIAQRFTLRAQSGADNSLDVIWVWRLEGGDKEPVSKSPGSAPP